MVRALRGAPPESARSCPAISQVAMLNAAPATECRGSFQLLKSSKPFRNLLLAIINDNYLEPSGNQAGLFCIILLE
ncbi:hypothetical protein N658DRAFT_43218 [Parathielavia hyrcaniae]|uniref:Uncharacterized protein n=1 Tax=Parathielavia hyrcaniae TaxID=113614 RepID=A0AAN6Q764_9PEZI|nr:hypothetical protein N658DRAFT_43218 [Parathielavia hyrcaniae]